MKTLIPLLAVILLIGCTHAGTTAEDRDQIRVLEAKRANALQAYNGVIQKLTLQLNQSPEAAVLKTLADQLVAAHKTLAAKCLPTQQLGEDAGKPDEYLQCVAKAPTKK